MVVLSRGNVYGFVSLLATLILGSICSESKYEEICNSLIFPDSVYDSTHTLKSKVSGHMVLIYTGYSNTMTHRIPYSGLHTG